MDDGQMSVKGNVDNVDMNADVIRTDQKSSFFFIDV